MEADYDVIFRIPSISASDGLPSKQFPLYGGTVTIPDGSTVIVMEYVNHTWRLLKSGSPVVSVPLRTNLCHLLTFLKKHFLTFPSLLAFLHAIVSRLYLKILALVVKHT